MSLLPVLQCPILKSYLKKSSHGFEIILPPSTATLQKVDLAIEKWREMSRSFSDEKSSCYGTGLLPSSLDTSL